MKVGTRQSNSSHCNLLVFFFFFFVNFLESLEAVLRQEKADLLVFESMPFHYVEIAEQLLTVCGGPVFKYTDFSFLLFLVLQMIFPMRQGCARC